MQPPEEAKESPGEVTPCTRVNSHRAVVLPTPAVKSIPNIMGIDRIQQVETIEVDIPWNGRQITGGQLVGAR